MIMPHNAFLQNWLTFGDSKCTDNFKGSTPEGIYIFKNYYWICTF